VNRPIQNGLAAKKSGNHQESALVKSVGRLPLASDRHDFGTLRAALVSGVALTSIMGLTSPADAAMRRMSYYDRGWFVSPAEVPTRSVRYPRSRGEPVASQRAEPKKDTGFGEMPKGPQQIVVNIATQKVTLYSNGVQVAQGGVSTGVPGHPTPLGVFSIIEKDRYHHSNIYSGAPMPFMQRITWSGVAMHEGVLPGYPASHGCIRLSHDFAQKLWPVTKLGVRVIVARHEVVPVEFKHAKLFVPKPKPAEPQVAMNAATDGTAVRLAQATAPDAASDAAAAAPEPQKSVPDVVAQPQPLGVNAAEPKAAEPNAAEPWLLGIKAADSAAAPVEAVKPAEEDVKAAVAVQPAEATPADQTATGTVLPAQPAAPAAPAELRKSVEVPVEPSKPLEVTPAAAPASPAEAVPANDVGKPSPTVDPAKPMVPRTKGAAQPLKLAGQVAVFVSRKEKKIFVRQGTVPLFDMPIAIDDPDRPLGTHVFTAMTVTDNGTGMRWNLMTIPTDPVAMMQEPSRRRSKEPPPVVVHGQLKPSSTPAEALERIQFPKEAVDRISELLTPGSSLVVSDAGLGPETGRGTEFIVLTR
jgi:L,D-transpeptidase catalytic domain